MSQRLTRTDESDGRQRTNRLDLPTASDGFRASPELLSELPRVRSNHLSDELSPLVSSNVMLHIRALCCPIQSRLKIRPEPLTVSDRLLPFRL